MKRSITLAPPNSVVFIMDILSGKIPISMNNALAAATPSCIAIGTLSADDGETHIELSTESAPGPGEHLVFEGELETPRGCFHVCSVANQILLESKVPSILTQLRVIANDLEEPDHIRIVTTR